MPEGLNPRLTRVIAAVGLLAVGFFGGIIYSKPSLREAISGGHDWQQVIEEALRRQPGAPDPLVFDRVWSRVQQAYVGQPVDTQKLYYGAVAGLVSVLGDRYSAFLDPEASREFQRDLQETSFEGIGAEIGARNDAIVIVAPLPGSPAERAGIKAGDRLFQIDGQGVNDMTVDEAVTHIRGKRGTSVSLTLGRAGQPEPITVSIVREKIVANSVRWELKRTPQEKPVAYVRVSHFSEETSRLFKKNVQELLLKQPVAVVLDLRNNPGGYLESAVDMASEFLDSGSTVVLEKRVSGESTPLNAEGTPRLKGIPVFVLVNGGSASASEILAGALHDHGVATLLGTQTFGKGSVQQYDEFPDGSSLKLTIATWYTPKGTSIHGEGITPDIEVKEEGTTQTDPVLERALAEIDAR